jgi:sedoheptulokinase
MILAGQSSPVTEASDAASFGVFDVENGVFDVVALEKAGMNIGMLPQLAAEPQIGLYQGKIPVYAAIGDNQASFLGATGGKMNSMLVNVGTGSQFSAYTQQYMACPGLETRPFPGAGYLLVGASLCGGRAYALLESFFRCMVETATGTQVQSCYDAMDKLLTSAEKPCDLPVVMPLFQGTRQDASLQGSITALTTENFTPRHFVWAMLEGMAKELYDMYQMYLTSGGKTAALIGSGNGLRKNPHLKACFEELFGVPLKMSECNEEAATGAALYADMQ